MASPKNGTTHYQDIKILWKQPGITACVTIYGFESYTRAMDSNGRVGKTYVPNIPVQFFPGVVESESGFCPAWVSDTPHNRKLIKELIDAGSIFTDSSIFEDLGESGAPVVDTTPADSNEIAGLMEKTNAELVDMATAMGLAPKGSWTKAQLVAAITGAGAV